MPRKGYENPGEGYGMLQGFLDGAMAGIEERELKKREKAAAGVKAYELHLKERDLQIREDAEARKGEHDDETLKLNRAEYGLKKRQFESDEQRKSKELEFKELEFATKRVEDYANQEMQFIDKKSELQTKMRFAKTDEDKARIQSNIESLDNSIMSVRRAGEVLDHKMNPPPKFSPVEQNIYNRLLRIEDADSMRQFFNSLDKNKLSPEAVEYIEYRAKRRSRILPKTAGPSPGPAPEAE